VSSNPIQVQEKEGVAHVMLDHPPVNVLTIDIMNRLADLLRQLGQTAQVVRLSGAGRGFCGGVDVGEHLPPHVERMIEAISHLYPALYECGAVTVAEVHGFALGGGLELAMACDLAFCAEGTQLGLPEIGLGVFPPVAAILLSERVGPNAALEWTLTGEPFSAEDALQAGLINGIYPSSRLQTEVDLRVDRLRSLSRPALRTAKSAVHRMAGAEFRMRLDQALRIYAEGMAKTQDSHEGLRAFLEKRKPRFENR
jgi:cyclohexa-1,5-dienecarbonyl-CoA hydratase